MSQEDQRRVDLIKPHFIALCEQFRPQQLVELLLQCQLSRSNFDISANEDQAMTHYLLLLSQVPRVLHLNERPPVLALIIHQMHRLDLQ